MAVISKPTDINKIWGSSGDVISPSDTKIQTGWVVEIPPRQWFNWLDNKQDQAIAHFNQFGIPLWDTVTEYQANSSYVQGSDGLIYQALVTNTGIDPVSDTAFNWKQAFQLGNYTSQVAVSASQTLTLAQSGQIINCRNNPTVTLPTGVSSSVGAAFQINNAGNGIVTVQAPVGQSLFGIGVSTPRTFVLGQGDYITVAYVGPNQWYAWGGVQLGASASFGSSLTNIGYQKLPSGYIENWGVATALGASETRVITLPAAFISGARAPALVGDGLDPRVRVAAIGLSSITIQNCGTAGQNAYWRVVGN